MFYSTLIFLKIVSIAISHTIYHDFNVHGSVKPGWEFVRDRFIENFAENRDLGASVCVYYQGESVINLTGGWNDLSRTEAYDAEKLQLVFSTTKGLVAAAVALCVDRGLLNYSDLVTKYWPEYANNGKDNTTIADVLSHRAGLPFLALDFQRFVNWTAMIELIQQEKPLWVPGTTHAYHSLTYGWLAGELVRRVDPKHRSFGRFVQEEIADHLEIDFFIGLPRKERHRLSPVVPLPEVRSNMNTTITGMFASWNDFRLMEAEVPGANGITNAWSVARLYAALMGDVENGKYTRLINDQTLKQAIQSNTPEGEMDFVLQYPSSFAMGFLVFDEYLPGFGSNIFGHYGISGSIGFAAPSKNLSFSYVMNQIENNASIIIDPRIRVMLTEIATKVNQEL